MLNYDMKNILLLLLLLNILMYTCKYVNPHNRSPLQEDIVDLPGLRTRLVDQLCRSRGLPSALTGLLTGQHGGPPWRSCNPESLNILHLVPLPSKFYHRPVNRWI